jgi:hypothetical protein
MVQGDAREPIELLLQALNQLERVERDAVLRWLLGAIRQPPDATLDLGMLNLLSARDRASELVGLLGGSPRGAQRAVPVRLPVDQHAALRDWCQEHGFAMATVIRGLVAQFLETQGASPPK